MHILSEFVLVFFDDILIFGKTADEHKKHIDIVLPLLQEHNILIKPSQCVWGQTELPYLGHIVGQDGIKPDPKKRKKESRRLAACETGTPDVAGSSPSQ